jgi:predicted RNA-binding Zn-ribbon protein involved in translation (DUF1610 family)
MNEHILYCPKCGEVILDYFDNKKDIIFGGICVHCSGFFKKYKLIDTGKSYDYFNEKAEPINEFSSNWREEVRKEFVYGNPLYNKKADMEHRKSFQQTVDKMHKDAVIEQSRTDTDTTPHCPTCNSTDIEKISTSSKVGKAALFGVLAIGSITKQFKCNNCGYKW